MEKDLLEISTLDLLEKFGAGKHKPGSGSAAAFQGMISAKLLATVIGITNRPRYQNTYKMALPRLLQYLTTINENIFPRLCDLFTQDAIEFDKAIGLRKMRIAESDPIRKNELRREGLEQMKVAIAIPLEICSLAIELCEIANYVFDHGFKSARGDSHVAFSGAVASLAGSMAIIRLNLLQFGSDDFRYCEGVHSKLQDLDLDYTNYNELATFKIEVLQKEYDSKLPFYIELNDLLDRLKSNTSPTDLEIETGIRDFQNLIWLHKNIIWKNPPGHPDELLNPELIFRDVLCYDFIVRDEFAVPDGMGGEQEVLGLINPTNRLVVISNKHSLPIQRFTGAHELTHALFHKHVEQHRDLMPDSTMPYKSRTFEEKVADKGATYFLMPAKSVTKEFMARFETDCFEIDQESAFNLTKQGIYDLRKECRNLSELARKLSRAGQYNNRFFVSLEKKFNVSAEAMAIRLEQLGLLKY